MWHSSSTYTASKHGLQVPALLASSGIHTALGIETGRCNQVMAFGTALHATEADEVTVINEAAVLHALDTQQYICTARSQQVVPALVE